MYDCTLYHLSVDMDKLGYHSITILVGSPEFDVEPGSQGSLKIPHLVTSMHRNSHRSQCKVPVTFV
jgi:hypothetical protein